VDCFVARAPRNDGLSIPFDWRHFRQSLRLNDDIDIRTSKSLN
jgi:hypothetical protein